MASSEDLQTFVASSFQSVWALELLLVLRREGRACSKDELIAIMRASPAVVEKAVGSLVAAGLAQEEEEGGASYQPVSAELDGLVAQTEQLYRSRPDSVRRLIIATSNRGLAAFSNAFRLKD